MAQDEFCAICEGRLTGKDSDHVCRTCFRQAREPKEMSVQMSDRAAERLGLGLLLGSVLTWGLGKLAEAAQAPLNKGCIFSMPVPKKPPGAAPGRLGLAGRGRSGKEKRRRRRKNG